MVFTSWGGTTQDAQKKAWAEPFTAAPASTSCRTGPTDYGKLKAMVEAAMSTGTSSTSRSISRSRRPRTGCSSRSTSRSSTKAELDPRFVTDHAVGSFYYSFVLGYNKDVLGDKAPKPGPICSTPTKFPGKRTFYKWSAPGVLEIALLADGVAADKLYPLDLDRAFKKLDTIKDDIVWWGGGAQSQQLLASGEAPLGLFWNGRVFARAGRPASMSACPGSRT